MYPSVTVQQRRCRTSSCPHCGSENFKKNGFFKRSGDSRQLQRYLCKDCKKTFSRAGYSAWYRYRYRRLNPLIHLLLVNSGTLRGIGRMVKIHPDTVGRHLDVMAEEAKIQMTDNITDRPKAAHVQMDDLITIEHSKLKQVSITLVSDADRYRMLGIRVSRVPTSGKNAEIAREKYGFRPDESIKNRDELLEQLIEAISPTALISTDEHKAYKGPIAKHFPKATHETHSAKRACIAGQGEMKEGGFDPLFCINHHLATLRAFISRLVRRTWNTTKNLIRLENHLLLFVVHYNQSRRPKSALQYEATVDTY